MAPRKTLTTALLSFACSLAPFACTSKAPVPADTANYSGGGGAAGGGGGGHDAGDARADGQEAGACAQLANGASVVEEQFVGDAVPPAIGGAIQPGTYFLTAARIYTGAGGNAGPTGQQLQETMLAADSNYQDVSSTGVADAGGLSPPVYTQGTYATAASTVTFSQTCPSAVEIKTTYSVVGGTLHLYAGSSELVLTLQ